MTTVLSRRSAVAGARPAKKPRSGVGRWRTAGVLAVLGGVYLALALSYSRLTPAWEANDEVAHVVYAQYIVEHRALPPIGTGIESAQPPLYYLTLAGWQRLLGIPVITPETSPPLPGYDPLGPQTRHDYTPKQHADAVHLHQLRLVSVVFGLVTVLATYGVASTVPGRRNVALASALFVAVLPKFDVVSATVQNDSLVIACCALALLCYLRWVRAGAAAGRRGRMWAVGLGATLGAAVLAKYTSLPLVGLLLALLTVEVVRRRRLVGLLDLGLAGGTAALTAGWWFLHNVHLYGEPLAGRATNAYLSQAMAGLLVPVRFLDPQRYGDFVPKVLLQSIWYDGGWNQWQLPFGLNLLLTLLAAIALAGGARVLVRGRTELPALPVERRLGAALAAAVTAGFVAVLLIAQTTTQAEGRYTYVGLAAFALLTVLGTQEIVDGPPVLRRMSLWVWPVLLVGVQVYVWHSFVLRYAGL